MTAKEDIGPLIGELLNTLLLEHGMTIETRKAIFTSMTHHLAQEYAFMHLEGVDHRELSYNFSSGFINGIECAMETHQKGCKKGKNCEALAALRGRVSLMRPKL